MVITQLKIERMEKEIRQRDLAADLGISVPTLADTERGKRIPKKLEREKLIKIFGKKIAEDWGE